MIRVVVYKARKRSVAHRSPLVCILAKDVAFIIKNFDYINTKNMKKGKSPGHILQP